MYGKIRYKNMNLTSLLVQCRNVNMIFIIYIYIYIYIYFLQTHFNELESF